MPARASSAMSRHSLPCRIAATSSPIGTLTTPASSDQRPVIAKYAPSTISGPISTKTSGSPSARYLYCSGGAV